MIAVRVLNLYAGIGGNRKKWDDVDVTAVEIDENIADVYREKFPDDKVVVEDAHEYLRQNYEGFDFIWASPPCPTHSKMHRIFTQSDAPQNKDRETEYPDMRLYQEIIFLQNFFDGKWCVENVDPYYEPLIPGQKRSRHMFWANFHIPPITIKKPKKFMNSSTKADKEQLCEWLGIELEEDPYPRGSHDPCHVLRNCVHPKLGKHVLNAARNSEDQTLRGFVEC